MGEGAGTDPEETIHAKLFIFGDQCRQHEYAPNHDCSKSPEKGAKIVVIDVHKNQTGRLADWFIPIRPGTDAALALGIMHVLFDENLHDEAFLTEYTEGSEELKAHVKHYDPETVSAITGVKADDIRRLARMYGKPPFPYQDWKRHSAP